LEGKINPSIVFYCQKMRIAKSSSSSLFFLTTCCIEAFPYPNFFLIVCYIQAFVPTC
jgi:hypothetical protein